MSEFRRKIDQDPPQREATATPFKSGDQLDLHASNLISLDEHRVQTEAAKVDIPQSPELAYPLHEVIGAYAIHSVRIRRDHLDAA